MESQAFGNNSDNNNCALLLPSPSPSLAHVVVVVLSVRTLLNSPLPRSQPSFVFMPLHCFLPAFLIVECSHHRSITMSIFLTSLSPHTSPSNSPLLFMLPETQSKSSRTECSVRTECGFTLVMQIEDKRKAKAKLQATFNSYAERNSSICYCKLLEQFPSMELCYGWV
jgi:hypothetical protein